MDFKQEYSEPEHYGYGQQLQSRYNQLQLALRNFLSFPLGKMQEPVLSIEEPLRSLALPQQVKARKLLARYTPEGALASHMTQQRFLENLAYLEWLDVFFQARPKAFQLLSSTTISLNCLDVGAKNWAYVNGLDAFIRCHFKQPYRLDGVELDPNRRYTSGHTRGQAALFYSQPLSNAQFHGMSALDWRLPVHCITHFLPFLAPETHLKWGLALPDYQPDALLRHLLSLLAPNGILMIVNQGSWEAEAQADLIEQAQRAYRFDAIPLGQLPSSFIQYRYPRFGWLCIQQEQ